jgi:hypothetical protein
MLGNQEAGSSIPFLDRIDKKHLIIISTNLKSAKEKGYFLQFSRFIGLREMASPMYN